MPPHARLTWILCAFFAASGWAVPWARAATPTAEQALTLKPVQADVDYDQPTAEEAKQCTIKAEKEGQQTGWVVRDPSGRILRRFVDTDGDNVVDQWCYYKDGIEIYRDFDTNGNGKADQCRWVNTGGMRWGIDANGNGQIDHWKQISAEEVSAELIAALANRDAARFKRLLLTPEEIKSLGLSPAREKDLSEKVAAAPSVFAKSAAEIKAIGKDTQWMHFGATRPGAVPAGTDGSTKDVLVYENVVVVVETGGQHDQLQLGTLIKAGDNWRLVDLPRPVEEGDNSLAGGGLFFQASMQQPANVPQPGTDAATERLQELLTQLETVDADLNKATSPAALAQAHAKRADVIEKIAEEASAEDRQQWLRQLADIISAATQLGEYPDGVDRLKQLSDKLEKQGGNEDLVAYFKFRYLQADYGLSLQSPQADFAKIQTRWLENLEQYVKQHPDSPDAAEAMLQLGIAEEYAGQEDKAKAWYGQIAKSFPGTPVAAKAAGAGRRLDSVGKVISLKGPTTDGKAVDLSKYRGRVVLIHYWATWSDLCKGEIETLKQLQAKYGKAGLSLVGVSVDNNPQELKVFLDKNRLPWPQVFEPGGLDGSRLANELGILTLPTMILVDKDGKVVNRSIHISQVEDELKRLLR